MQNNHTFYRVTFAEKGSTQEITKVVVADSPEEAKAEIRVLHKVNFWRKIELEPEGWLYIDDVLFGFLYG